MLAPVLRACVVVIMVATCVADGTTTVVASVPDPTPPPVVTANEFLPDERNLSECVGVLERPGCGSEERGGAAQTVVFVVVLAAMGLIFGRIAVGVRRNRAGMDAPTSATPSVEVPSVDTPSVAGPAPGETVDP